MGRSQETSNKKEIRNKKEKKRKEKAEKKAKRKSEGKITDFNDMIAYVDEFGKLSSSPPDLEKRIIVAPESIEIKIPRNRSESVSSREKQGVVISFNKSKGFGFIRESDSTRNIFVHANNLTEPISENDVVTYELGKGAKGAIALNVKRLK